MPAGADTFDLNGAGDGNDPWSTPPRPNRSGLVRWVEIERAGDSRGGSLSLVERNSSSCCCDGAISWRWWWSCWIVLGHSWKYYEKRTEQKVVSISSLREYFDKLWRNKRSWNKLFHACEKTTFLPKSVTYFIDDAFALKIPSTGQIESKVWIRTTVYRELKSFKFGNRWSDFVILF